MLYTQFRENERTARYEVKLVPGNRCQLVSAGATSEASETKTRTKRATAATARPEWTIGEREEASWVDLEAELMRLSRRASIDLGLKTGENAGSELLKRLNYLLDGLYRHDTPEDYLTYLGLLNICEYLRILSQLKRTDTEANSAKQVGIVGDEYFQCRKIALELDLAELTEWLVAHDIGLPNLAIFFPSEYASDEVEAATPAAPKKKGRKKAGEEAPVEEPAQPAIPEGLRHTAELIRLHQAGIRSLVRFVDDVMQRGNHETPEAAILAIQEVVPWLDTTQFGAEYQSHKIEQQLETERQQASILRQREAFNKQPKRGLKHRDRNDPRSRKLELKKAERVTTPLDEFASSINEDPNEAYERAMAQALDRPDGMEFLPNDFADHGDEGDDQDHHDDRHDNNGDDRHDDENFGDGFEASEDQKEAASDMLHTDHDDDDSNHDLFSNSEDHDDDREDREEGDEGGEQREEFDENGQSMGPRFPSRRRRRRRGPKPNGPAPHNAPHHAGGPQQGGAPHPRDRRQGGGGPQQRQPHGGGQGPRREGPPQGGPKGPRREKPKREGPPRRSGGGGQPNFDEIQPASNYSPGLVPGVPPNGGPAGGGAKGGPKKNWKRRR